MPKFKVKLSALKPVWVYIEVEAADRQQAVHEAHTHYINIPEYDWYDEGGIDAESVDVIRVEEIDET